MIWQSLLNKNLNEIINSIYDEIIYPYNENSWLNKEKATDR